MLDESVVRAMHIDCSVEGVVDSQTSDVRAAHVPVQMKMDWVSTQTEGLASMGNLNVAQVKHCRFSVRLWCMGNDVNTKLVTSSLRTKSSLETGLGCKLPCNNQMHQTLQGGSNTLCSLWYLKSISKDHQ